VDIFERPISLDDQPLLVSTCEFNHLVICNHAAIGLVRIVSPPLPVELQLPDRVEASHYFSHVSLDIDLKQLQLMPLSRVGTQRYQSLGIALGENVRAECSE